MSGMQVPANNLRIGTILLLALALLPGPCLAAAAGRVVFTAGAPKATDTAGTSRDLKRGDDVFSGETLATNTGGRLQVSFADGAYISLQPDSTYVIEQYAYAGAQDGSEKAVYRLLKGGVRALTGAIGKQHPDAYRVETPVATIGIRGSGHNSRLCAGDCPGHEDGLYHNTWRGLTYVRNNVDERDVPRGRGVFVAGLDLPIRFLDQPPGLTAVDTGGQREEEQEEKEEVEQRFQVGDQRDEEGEQIIIRDGDDDEEPPPPPPPPEETSRVITGIGFQGVAPDDESSDGVDSFSYDDLKLFVRDRDDAPVGFLGLLEEDDGEILELATIDPDAVLAADDTAAADLASSLLATADPAAVAFFEENPAHAEDVFDNGEIGMGRWTGGRVLVVSEDGETDVPDFTGFQSAHFIYGPEPTSFPTGEVHATYNFLAGTKSTSVSGTTIGEGVTGGFVQVDFINAMAFLEMDVTHDSIDYLVSGELLVDPVEHSITDALVTALPSTTVAGCSPYCPTFIDGGFAGPDAGGVPKYIGFEYDIQNTMDVITGVAGFQVQSADGGP